MTTAGGLVQTGTLIPAYAEEVRSEDKELFDNAGIMQTGWVKDSGKWYMLNNSSAMVTGWFKDTDGKWYYLNSDGSMAINTIVGGYKVGADGAWIK